MFLLSFITISLIWKWILSLILGLFRSIVSVIPNVFNLFSSSYSPFFYFLNFPFCLLDLYHYTMSSWRTPLYRVGIQYRPLQNFSHLQFFLSCYELSVLHVNNYNLPKALYLILRCHKAVLNLFLTFTISIADHFVFPFLTSYLDLAHHS